MRTRSVDGYVWAVVSSRLRRSMTEHGRYDVVDEEVGLLEVVTAKR